MGLLGSFTSAHHRSIITALVLLKVESNDLSTIHDSLVDIVAIIRLHTGGEGFDLIVSARVPGHTLDETASSTDGIEVNAAGGVLELHWVSFADVLIIRHWRGQGSVHVPLPQLVVEGRSRVRRHNYIDPQNTLVQRSCCTLLMRPSASMLSHTRQNTSNFSRRVRLLP